MSVESELGYEHVVDYQDWSTFKNDKLFFARHKTGFYTRFYNDAAKLKEEIDKDKSIIEAARIIGYMPGFIPIDLYAVDGWLCMSAGYLSKQAETLKSAVRRSIGYGWNNNAFVIKSKAGYPAIQVGFAKDSINLWVYRTGTALAVIGRGKNGVSQEEITFLKKSVNMVSEGLMFCTVKGHWFDPVNEQGHEYGYAGMACDKCFDPEKHRKE